MDDSKKNEGVAEYELAPVYPQDLEHASLRAHEFGVRSLATLALMGQIGNFALMEEASKVAFRENDLQASATYAQYAHAYEELLSQPALFQSPIAGDC